MNKKEELRDELFDRYYYEFMALSDYNWKMEQSISNLIDEENNISDSYENGKIKSMRKVWEQWKLYKVFPTTLRYSFITTLYIHVEDKLSEVCKFVKTNNKLNLNLIHFSGSFLQKVKRYLEVYAQLPIETSQWEVIEEVSKIRDCIVHCNGNVSKSRDQKYLRNLCSSELLNIEEDLDREADWIKISDNYTLLVTKRIQDFFEYLRFKVKSA